MSVISLKHTGSQETLLLPDRLVWVGEYAWSPVAHEAHWGTDGALLLHVARRQAGRPIELQGTASEAWLPRSTVQQLHAWASLKGQVFELTLRGQRHTVVFDHTQGSAFEAEPLWPLLDGEYDAGTLYRPTLRFMEV